MTEKTERVVIAVSRKSRQELDLLRMALVKSGREPVLPNVRRATELAVTMALDQLQHEETTLLKETR